MGQILFTSYIAIFNRQNGTGTSEGHAKTCHICVDRGDSEHLIFKLTLLITSRDARVDAGGSAGTSRQTSKRWEQINPHQSCGKKRSKNRLPPAKIQFYSATGCVHRIKENQPMLIEHLRNLLTLIQTSRNLGLASWPCKRRSD